MAKAAGRARRTRGFDPEAEGLRLAAALLNSAPELSADLQPTVILAQFADTIMAATRHVRAAGVWITANDLRDSDPIHVNARARHWALALNSDGGGTAARRALARMQPTARTTPARRRRSRIFPLGRRRGRNAAFAIPFALPGPDRGAGLVLFLANRRNYFGAPVRKVLTAYAAIAEGALAKTEPTPSTEISESEADSAWDSLTAVPTYRFLHDRLGQALGAAVDQEQRLALALVDLVDFRDINEHYGRAVGDHALSETARRLRQALPPRSLLARVGGNEFALLVPKVETEKKLHGLLAACVNAIGADYRIGERVINLEARIGATICARARHREPDGVLREASLALNRAKIQGSNPICLYDPAVGLNTTGRHAVAESVRVALREDRFVLHFQPQLDTRSPEPAITAVEALIRMSGSGGEIHRPDEFIGIAEESVLIQDIGEWVINEGLAQAARWRRAGLNLSLGVNVGARHLLHDRFTAQLRAALARHPDVPPAQLEIEITETAALSDLERAHRVLTECRKLGVGVAVDDFGTGHASLTYVQSLPVTRIKVDQHFVRGLPTEPRNMAVIAGTVTSSRLLDIDIVAEGVETVLHGLTLMRLGCGLLQGYALTAPLSEAGFRSWLRTWQPPKVWRDWAGRRVESTILPLLAAEITHRRYAAQLLGPSIPPPDSGLAECTLTHWLAGEGQTYYGRLSEWGPLRAAHAQFHRSAAALRTSRCGAGTSRVEVEGKTLARDAEALINSLAKMQDLIWRQESQAR